METRFSLTNKTRVKIPVLPFSTIKNDILGEKYSLSIAFVSQKQSQKINKEYRNKNKPTNILSFPLSKDSGEIIMCPAIIKSETDKFGRNFGKLLGYLTIHGMLHLKGFEHSSTMERSEEKYDKKYFRRNRCGIHRYKSCSGRNFEGRKKS